MQEEGGERKIVGRPKMQKKTTSTPVQKETSVEKKAVQSNLRKRYG
jgi:hypothetical protein